MPAGKRGPGKNKETNDTPCFNIVSTRVSEQARPGNHSIDLADKLKAAMEGGADEEEGEEEMDMDMGDEEAEMDMDMEEPGMRDMMEEELYEAALRGLDIEVVDDKAEQREALMNEAKARIYERVIKRLLKESKK